jgi:hypothetical protein
MFRRRMEAMGRGRRRCGQEQVDGRVLLFYYRQIVLQAGREL